MINVNHLGSTKSGDHCTVQG